jgi:hypothetical protein
MKEAMSLREGDGMKADCERVSCHDSYFPAIGLFLGWPLLAEKIVDGHV